MLNEEVIDLAIRAGLALNCRISTESAMDRKQYYYPDLPKGYQITQYKIPLCQDGHIEIMVNDVPKVVGIARIHIEEDAGKLIHDEKGTFIDFNRSGVPLIEIVSWPDLRSGEEAREYLKALRAVLISAGVSDCRMNEGSMRCDVNISVRKRGEERMGTRTEIKNLNSFRFVAKAIDYEANRQKELILRGEPVFEQTLRFDAATGKTAPMRQKEGDMDYRYLPEPDLGPIVIDEGRISRIKALLPPLPRQLQEQFEREYKLSRYDAQQLTAQPEIAGYFERCAQFTTAYKQIANLIITEGFRLLPPESFEIPISPKHLACLAELMSKGRLNNRMGKQVFLMLWEKDADPVQLIREHNLDQITDKGELLQICQQVMQESPGAVADYKSGKEKAFNALLGSAMAKTRGRANPEALKELLFNLLK